MAETSGRMTCMEVWGGHHVVAQGVEFGGLEGWVYSKPHGESELGGDVYYASSCGTGRITRLLLADVSGHGSAVADIADGLRGLMRKFVNRLDQTEFVTLLNRQFGELSKDGAYATAVVATFFSPSRRLSVCNAGHPSPMLYRAANGEWTLLRQERTRSKAPRNTPLGMLPMAEYEQFDVELESGDCVLCYTDALIESNDSDGEMFGEAGLLNLVRSLTDCEQPRDVAGRLLDEINRRYPGNLTEDDVTVLAIRANGRGYTYADAVRSVFRIAGSYVGSVVSGKERPLLPDWNVANMGGALMPALGRRWHAKHRV